MSSVDDRAATETKLFGTRDRPASFMHFSMVLTPYQMYGILL